MVANTSPTFTLIANLSTNNSTGMSQPITIAAADYTGAGANNVLVHTAPAADGSYVRRLRFKATSTNVAAVMRIYLNNGSTNATITNNTFVGEMSLPATTATTTAGTPDLDYIMEMAIPAGWRIYVGLGAAVAGGWTVTTIAGNYS